MPTSRNDTSRRLNSRISTLYSASLAGLVVAINSWVIWTGLFGHPAHQADTVSLFGFPFDFRLGLRLLRGLSESLTSPHRLYFVPVSELRSGGRKKAAHQSFG